MSEDFNVGDVVSCVDREGSVPFGTVARVLGMCSGIAIWDGRSVTGLHLNIQHPNNDADGWDSRFWRKLPRADEEFTRQMRACKPKRVLLPAGIEGRG